VVAGSGEICCGNDDLGVAVGVAIANGDVVRAMVGIVLGEVGDEDLVVVDILVVCGLGRDAGFGLRPNSNSTTCPCGGARPVVVVRV